jgi:hypothetical protein
MSSTLPGMGLPETGNERFRPLADIILRSFTLNDRLPRPRSGVAFSAATT